MRPLSKKINKALLKAQQRQEAHDDVSKIKQSSYGYRDDEPAVVTKTTLDKQDSHIGRNLLLFIFALFALIICGIGIKSAVNHESPLTYVVQGFKANKPAKWKPSSDPASGHNYNFGSASFSSNQTDYTKTSPSQASSSMATATSSSSSSSMTPEDVDNH